MKKIRPLIAITLINMLLSCGDTSGNQDGVTSENKIKKYTLEDILREKNTDGRYWFRLKDGDTLFGGETFELTNFAFQNNYCIVGKTIDGKMKRGVIDLTGRLVVGYKYQFLEANEGGGYFKFMGASDNYGLTLGYVDSTGKEVIPQKFKVSSGVRDNMVKLQNTDKKWGILTMQNKVVIPFEYDGIGKWNEDIAVVQKKKEGYGYVNKSGGLIIPLKYEDGLGFEQGVALVKQNGKWGLINKNDQPVSDFVYDKFEWVVDVVENEIDPSGFSQENKRFVMDEGYIILQKNGKWGYLDVKGRIVIPFEYNTISVPSLGKVRVVKNGKNGHFNLQSGEVSWD